MNIVFVSKLDDAQWLGPSQSVPAQIKAQSIIDNILWFNANEYKLEKWKSDSYVLVNKTDIPSMKLCDFPTPFNNPDLVVFEGCYEYPFFKMIFEIWKRNIPYIIIPRSQLTIGAQHSKRIKKFFGNILFFDRFIKKAAGIHYLTKKELTDSNKYKKRGYIIPNGVNGDAIQKKKFSGNCIVATYIGRIRLYQKGLDLLLDGIEKEKEYLDSHGFKLNMYGPDLDGAVNELNSRIVQKKLQKFVHIYDSIFDEKKKAVLNGTDVFIMTSRFEGHPMGLIEALSYGLPALVTDGTNMADEIKECNAGWYAGDTSETIAKALRKMCDEKGFIPEKGQNAYNLSQKYKWNEIAKLTHVTFERITGGK